VAFVSCALVRLRQTAGAFDKVLPMLARASGITDGIDTLSMIGIEVFKVIC
jgi:hypothetical protein